ncbi:MAG: aminopeptidase P family protein [Oscillospiraceae bacterium]|nr:aminopeptidase P family protein [Oscillospiraceae bacterium]
MIDILTRLANALPDGADAALIESDVNRRYLTGMKSSAGTLLVTREGSYLVIDFRYFEKAKATAKDCKVILQDKLYQQIKELCQKHGVKTLAIEGERMTVARLSQWKKQLDVEFVTDGLDEAINGFRSVKTADELDIMRSAQKITDRAFAELLNFIKEGRTEREVKNELERLLCAFGGDGIAFDTIAVSGKNSSMPHGTPTDKKLCAGDFLTLDFGAKKDGYCSDMTRTVAIGYASDEQQKVYNTVLEAQRRAVEVIRAGVKCSDVDFAARDYIENQCGYKGCFGHGLGHSLGLEIHEGPSFSPLSQAVAKSGNVLSVEPGIYLEGQFGVRIEDVVIIGENGFEDITASPKQLIIL